MDGTGPPLRRGARLAGHPPVGLRGLTPWSGVALGPPAST